jgi:hypothetical protein
MMMMMMNQSLMLRSVHIVNPKKENQFITTPSKMLNTYLQNIGLKGSQIISLPGRPHLGPTLAGLIIFSEASVSSTCTPDASINETHLLTVLLSCVCRYFDTGRQWEMFMPEW